MKTKFPKVIFVTIENAGTQDEYHAVSLNPQAVAEVGSTKKVGIYSLSHIAEVSATVDIKHGKKR